ncbi:MAG: MBL fold metallo-hydrolase [Bacteroidales bacterium]|jgi:phosphoribosyl 1,2-cyclic phosphate phosphodiesterase|nr:MBL fold metallo-hydrolase [Bacteroidales bacterium]
MKLTFLGTGTSQGVPVVGCPCEVCLSKDVRDNRLRTSAYLEIADTKLLFDAGPDLRQQLLQNNITQVDAILVTHEHKDHIGGIDDIRPVNFLMEKTVNIYGLRRTLNVIAKDYDYAFKEYKYPGVPELKLIPVQELPFQIDEILITPISVKHLHLSVLGYRIGSFAYVTDASFIAPKEKEKLKNLEVLVLNSLRIAEHYSHFNLAQSLALIKEVHPKRAFLTHIGHDMGKHAVIDPQLPENVCLATDRLTVEI